MGKEECMAAIEQFVDQRRVALGLPAKDDSFQDAALADSTNEYCRQLIEGGQCNWQVMFDSLKIIGSNYWNSSLPQGTPQPKADFFFNLQKYFHTNKALFQEPLDVFCVRLVNALLSNEAILSKDTAMLTGHINYSVPTVQTGIREVIQGPSLMSGGRTSNAQSSLLDRYNAFDIAAIAEASSVGADSCLLPSTVKDIPNPDNAVLLVIQRYVQKGTDSLQEKQDFIRALMQAAYALKPGEEFLGKIKPHLGADFFNHFVIGSRTCLPIVNLILRSSAVGGGAVLHVKTPQAPAMLPAAPSKSVKPVLEYKPVVNPTLSAHAPAPAAQPKRTHPGRVVGATVTGATGLTLLILAIKDAIDLVKAKGTPKSRKARTGLAWKAPVGFVALIASALLARCARA